MTLSRARWVLLVFLAACAPPPPVPPTPAPAAPAAPAESRGSPREPGPVDAEQSCKDVVGRTFTSHDALPGGNSPTGPVKTHWTVRIGAGKYSWSYSDMVVSGHFECRAGELRGVGPGSELHGAHYDRATQTLVWEGQRYDASPPEAP